MPMPAGTRRGWPAAKIARWAWMWNSTCSVRSQRMPSMVWPAGCPPPGLDAGWAAGLWPPHWVSRASAARAATRCFPTGLILPGMTEGPPDFLVHDEGDHVGVAVRDVEPGRRRAVHLDSDRELAVDVLESVPLGHKVALADLGEGAEVVEYRVRIGLTRAPV